MTAARSGRVGAGVWIACAALVAVAAVLAVLALLPAGRSVAAPGVGSTRTGLSAVDDSLLGAVPAGGGAAPGFTLTDQHGRSVPLAGLRGRAVVLTFDDDRCTDVCTLYAEDVLAAWHDLGGNRSRVAFVSVNANPYYPTVADVRDWTDAHGLGGTAGWSSLTGPPATLAAVAKSYGETVRLDASTRTIEHGTDIALIDPSGHERLEALYGSESADTALYGHALADAAVSLLPAAERRPVAGTSGHVDGSGSLVGRPGSLSLPALGDASKRVGPVAGRFTVLVFFSSSCTACVTELPGIEQEYRERHGRVDVLGVDVADRSAAAEALVRRTHVTFPVGTDATGSAAARFGVDELPFTVLLSGDGTVLTSHPGLLTADQLDYLLQVLPAS